MDIDTSHVVVTGRARVPAEPDEVRLSLDVSALRHSAQEALTDVATRSESLDAILRELGIDRSAWSTTGVSVQEKREWVKDRYIHRGYEAENRIAVRLTDESKVGTLIRRATSEADAHVAGPYWQIALANPARIEAHKEAARAARRQAEAYADALGVRLGAPLRVGPPGFGSAYHDRSEEYGVRASMAAAAPDPEPEVEVSAGTLEVSDAVEIAFALEPV